jgi:hypothetical protein
MAKVTWHGWAKPDDPIYRSGPIVGGKRIGSLVKNGKVVSETEDAKPDKKPDAKPKDA